MLKSLLLLLLLGDILLGRKDRSFCSPPHNFQLPRTSATLLTFSDITASIVVVGLGWDSGFFPEHDLDKCPTQLQASCIVNV